MKRDLSTTLRSAAVFLVLLACLAAIVIGQRTTSWTSLGVMLAALGVLIALLARYNRKFR